jgi:hypothetical protein
MSVKCLPLVGMVHSKRHGEEGVFVDEKPRKVGKKLVSTGFLNISTPKK